MTESIINSLIGIVPAVLVAVVSIISNNQIVKVKIEELEKKVDKHNQIVERTYKLESDVKTAFNKLDEERQRIERLEDREMK
ncbi:hypothetical protein IKE71_04100 [Candidatus Saccharibacteria bacterium]|nr:hypothetical protein [Candidatus Saccharibacteria bacterium]